MNLRYFVLTVLLLFPLQAVAHDDGENTPPPPPPGDSSHFGPEEVKAEVDLRCAQEPEEEVCHIDQLQCAIQVYHELRDENLICPEIFHWLVKEAEMKIAYHHGYKDGFEDGRNSCAPGGGETDDPGTTPDDDPELDPGDGDSAKVQICHIPPGNPDNAHTIEVGEAAVEAHLNHGDTLGACEESATEESADSATSEATKKKNKKQKKKKKRKSKRKS